MFANLAQVRTANRRAGQSFFDPSHSPTDVRMVLLYGAFVLVHKRDEGSDGSAYDRFHLYQVSTDGTMRPATSDRPESWEAGHALAATLAGHSADH